jgi:hypothetical protein
MIKLKYEMDDISLRVIIDKLTAISNALYNSDSDIAIDNSYNLDKVIEELESYLV